MERWVTVSQPQKKPVLSKTYLQEGSPYQVVERSRSKWRQGAIQNQDPFGSLPIAEVMPLHNYTGIRDKKMPAKMTASLQKGLEILEADRLPNIKFVVAPNSKLLLFDGHHSLLSYFLFGKMQLTEIPYLVVSGPDFGPITSSEIAYFFPQTFRELVTKNWIGCVVNWEAPEEKKLEKREVASFGQLADQFRKRDKGAVKE